MLFPASDKELCVDITVNNDAIALEPDESFELLFTILSSRDIAVPNIDHAIVTIIDDDSKLSLHLLHNINYSGININHNFSRNGNGTVTVCLTKNATTSTDIDVIISYNSSCKYFIK